MTRVLDLARPTNYTSVTPEVVLDCEFRGFGSSISSALTPAGSSCVAAGGCSVGADRAFTIGIWPYPEGGGPSPAVAIASGTLASAVTTTEAARATCGNALPTAIAA